MQILRLQRAAESASSLQKIQVSNSSQGWSPTSIPNKLPGDANAGPETLL